MSASKIDTRWMSVTALCVAVIVVCAQIAIPLPNMVPVTLQTFAVALTGFLLTPKRSVMALSTYLLLGAVGVPVFSNFQGGMHRLVGATGGFLLGFLGMALLCSLSKKPVWMYVLGLAGLLLLHVCGVAQYALLTGRGFFSAALLVSVPFLVKDAASVIVAAMLAQHLRKVLRFPS